jgi:hypothetical protein
LSVPAEKILAVKVGNFRAEMYVAQMSQRIKYKYYNISTKKSIFLELRYMLKTDIYSYLETFGDQSYNLFLDVVHFFKTSLN